MSCDWFKFQTSLPTDPRVIRIARMIGVVPALALGPIVALWSIGDRHAVALEGSQDGDALLRGYTPEDIDAVLGVPGFAAAYIAVGWMRTHPEGVVLVRWMDHNGQSAKARAQAADRMRKSRSERNATPTPEHTPPATAQQERNARCASVTEPAQPERNSGATRVERREEKIPPSEAAPPRSPRAAAAEAAAGPGFRVPGFGEAGGKQPPPPQPQAVRATRGGAGGVGAGGGASQRGGRDGAPHPLLTAAAWRPAATETADLKRLDLVLIDVKLAAEKGQITLERTAGGGCESGLEFVIRRAEAYGKSDAGRKFPTSLRKFLHGDPERGPYWLDPDERWADVSPSRKGGSGGAADGGMTPEQVERLREKNLADADRRHAEAEALRAQRPSAEEVSAILGRVRRNGSHPEPRTLNPEPALSGASEERNP